MNNINELSLLERLKKLGVQALTDKELVIVLHQFKQINFTETEIENLFDSIDYLTDLWQIDSVSLTESELHLRTILLLQITKELQKRALLQRLQKKSLLNHRKKVQTFLQHQLSHRQNEIFAMLLLDVKYHLINYIELYEGTIDEAVVYPREVVKMILKYNAKAVIFAHNHPSGDDTASPADQLLLQTLRQLLELIDVRVVDHIIVRY